MRRFIPALFAISALSFGAAAAPLTPAEALQRLSASGAPKKVAGSLSSLKLVHTSFDENGDASLYMFDRSAGGYVILSADDVAEPMLGYADSGSFDAENMPPQMKWWLGEYAREIKYAAANGYKAPEVSAERDNRPVIAQMMSTKWNQDAPYFNDTPTINGTHTPTGCVATAMAQVMKYWNYPQAATGRVSITLPTGAQGSATLNLARVKLDWDNMLDVYESGKYNDAQATAVADLMKACGYASNMTYKMGGSGTLARFGAQALVDNFFYNKNLQYCERDFYTTVEWEAMLYNELAAGRPVLYGGSSSSVGHEFVCDGYAGDGYFHFNWGWGGMSDGYFLLGALSPGSVGIGGGTGSDGFNTKQDMIIGVQPETTAPYTPRLTQYGNLTATVSGSSITMMAGNGNDGYWVNSDFRTINVKFGVVIMPVAGSTGRPISISMKATEFAPPVMTPVNGGYSASYSGFPGKLTIDVGGKLEDGTYRAVISTQDASIDGAEWAPVLVQPGKRNYCYITVAGDKYSVSYEIPTPLNITEGSLLTDCYFGGAVKMKLVVNNPTSTDISGMIIPRLAMKGEYIMEAEGRNVTIGAGETVTEEFITTFRLIPGKSAPTRSTSYDLYFVDAESGNPYSFTSSVRMNVNTNYSVAVDNFTIDGYSTVEEGGKTVYKVSNKASVPMTLNMTSTGIFFGYGLCVQVTEDAEDSPVLGTLPLSPTLILKRSEKGTASGVLNFMQGEPGRTYVAKLYAMLPSGLQLVENAPELRFTIDSSGVDEMKADNSLSLVYDSASRTVYAYGSSHIVSIDVFDVNGRKVANVADSASLALENLAGGVVVVVARDADGTVKTKKIML